MGAHSRRGHHQRFNDREYLTSGDLIHFTGSAVHNIVFNGFNLTTSTSSGSSGAHALIDIDATTSGGANIQIENCTLTTGTRGCVDGILVNASTGNLINNNVLNGLYCYSSGYTYIGNGIVVTSGTNNKIYNNDIYDCGHRTGGTTMTWELTLTGADNTTLVANNIIQGGTTDTYESGISEQSPSASLRLNNIIYNCVATYGSTTSTGSGESTVNPLLTTPGTTWTLQSTSPAIDAGVCIYGVNQTYNGAWPDIGAYEYAGTPGTLNTVTGTITDSITSAAISGATVAFGSHGTAITSCEWHVYAGNASGLAGVIHQQDSLPN